MTTPLNTGSFLLSFMCCNINCRLISVANGYTSSKQEVTSPWPMDEGGEQTAVSHIKCIEVSACPPVRCRHRLIYPSPLSLLIAFVVGRRQRRCFHHHHHQALSLQSRVLNLPSEAATIFVASNDMSINRMTLYALKMMANSEPLIVRTRYNHHRPSVPHSRWSLPLFPQSIVEVLIAGQIEP